MKKIFLTTLIFLLCVPLFSFSAYAAEYPIIYNPQHIQIFNYDESSDLDTGLEFSRAISLNQFKYVAALRSDVTDYANWDDLSYSIFTKGNLDPFVKESYMVSTNPFPSADLFPHVIYGTINSSSFNVPCLINIPIGLQLSVSPDSSTFDGYIGLSFSFVTANFIIDDVSDNYIDYFFQEYGACTAYTSSSPLNLLYSIGTPIKLKRQVITKSVLYPADSSVGVNRYLYNVDVALDMKYSDLITSSSSDYVTFVMNIPYNFNYTLYSNSSFRFYANIPDSYKLYSLDSVDSSLKYIESQLDSLNTINNELYNLLSDIQLSDLNTIISSLSDIYSSLDHLDYIVRFNIYPAIDQIETILNTSLSNELTIISLLYDLKSSIGNQNTELIHYFNIVDPADEESLDQFDDSISNLGNIVSEYDDVQTRIENIVNNVTLPSVQSDVSNVLNRAPDVVERIGNVFTNSYFTAALVIVFGFCAINLILYGISKGD